MSVQSSGRSVIRVARPGFPDMVMEQWTLGHSFIFPDLTCGICEDKLSSFSSYHVIGTHVLPCGWVREVIGSKDPSTFTYYSVTLVMSQNFSVSVLYLQREIIGILSHRVIKIRGVNSHKHDRTVSGIQ
jgi:hypothetical protein